MALKTQDSPLRQLSISNLYNALVVLGPREKIIALVGIALLLLMALFLPFSLVSSKLHSMQREIATIRSGYQDVVTKIQELKGVKQEMEEMEKRLGRGGGLTSRVEGAARKLGLTVDQLKEKPSQDTDFLEIQAVELRLAGVRLSQLTEFLYEIENDPSALMRLRRIQIKPKFSSRQQLDVSCEIATFAVRKEL